MEEKDICTIKIDGKKISLAKGSTVLEGAKMLGIFIPTLCYHEALPPRGNCRLCIVEMSIVKRGRTYSWIDASCVYPVEDGLIVQTDTPKVRRERKLILELLLSRAPDSDVLNKLAVEYDADKNRFVSSDNGDSNCILCGLCVDVCNNLMHSSGIGTAFRGINKKVVSPFNITQEVCTGCLACISVCPTGAIKARFEGENLNIETWNVKLKMLKCHSCGKPFYPGVYVDMLKDKVTMAEELLKKCPECRRKVFRLSVK
ncbi:MAG: (2Fe-2S)-binding protein [Spirochaetales bacterium]|nr:(2Fe-2S)-binding protein [Spirochaetales bacterium]